MMHAGWNLLARRRRSETAFFARFLLIIAAAGFVPVAVSEAVARSIPPGAWACAVGSGLFCSLYFFYLARAYECSDFTIVYPIARSLPVILVAVGDVLRGRYPSAAGWLGMLLVVSGCSLAPLRSIREFAPRRYFNRAGLWMVAAAMGTVGYTLFDKVAAEMVRQGPATAARYCYVFFLISFGGYSLLLALTRRGERPGNDVGWRLPFLAGVLNFGSYWLIVWTYQMVRHASYLLAFRQTSIVIGVIVGFIIYREKGVRVRLSAAFLITAGLVLISRLGD